MPCCFLNTTAQTNNTHCNSSPPSKKIKMSQVSQPPFLTFTANTPFSPSSSFSRTTSADPKDNSQAESNYLPVLQYRKSCVRCDIQGLICVEDTNGDGIVARCQACRWANEKCKLDIDGRLVTVGKRGRSTYSKKCVYVDEQGQDIAEWPFKYVDDSPSVTDADDPAICKFFSACLSFFPPLVSLGSFGTHCFSCSGKRSQ